MLADPGGLSRVLANLVSNAVRHTPAGGAVEILGTGLIDGVEVTVTDGCGGIDDDDLDRVFDLAWTGTAARTPGIPGRRDTDAAASAVASEGSQAGLGLAIVKGIVEAHGGEVSVGNVRAGGAGCRFVVRLPQPAAVENS